MIVPVCSTTLKFGGRAGEGEAAGAETTNMFFRNMLCQMLGEYRGALRMQVSGCKELSRPDFQKSFSIVDGNDSSMSFSGNIRIHAC